MEIAFPSVGGTQRAKVQGPEDGPVVVVAPAMGIQARYYGRLVADLAKNGLASVAVDHPGHGDSPARASRALDWGYAEMVGGLGAAIEALSPRPVVVLGHSIGGQAALLLADRAPTLQRLVLVGSGTPFIGAWSGGMARRIRLASTLFPPLSSLLGHHPGTTLGFGGREAPTVMRQWSHLARTGSYDLPQLDGEALLARPGPPVHAIELEDDEWAPESAIRHVTDKLVQREVTFEVWRDHGTDHNRWPTRPDFIVDKLVSELA